MSFFDKDKAAKFALVSAGFAIALFVLCFFLDTGYAGAIAFVVFSIIAVAASVFLSSFCLWVEDKKKKASLEESRKLTQAINPDWRKWVAAEIDLLPPTRENHNVKRTVMDMASVLFSSHMNDAECRNTAVDMLPKLADGIPLTAIFDTPDQWEKTDTNVRRHKRCGKVFKVTDAQSGAQDNCFVAMNVSFKVCDTHGCVRNISQVYLPIKFPFVLPKSVMHKWNPHGDYVPVVGRYYSK